MTPSTPLPWREIIKWAAAGLLLTTTLVFADSGGNTLALLQPGEDGPSAATFHEDFPGVEFPDGLGFDGQQFYAVARSPFDLDATSDELDQPRYRLRRPVFSMAAWLLHPTGGGDGLATAFLIVGMLGLLIGGLATGALSASLRGPPWMAAVFPLLPGAYFTLRVSVADALALGLALATVTLLMHERTRAAVVVAVLAVLTKETVILVLLGWALYRRSRHAWAAVVVPGVVLVGWMAALTLLVPAGSGTVGAVGLPFAGIIEAATDRWIEGRELWAALTVPVALGLSAVALYRHRLGHPLSWILALQVLLILVSDHNVVGNDLGGPRVTMGAMVIAAIMLATTSNPTHPASGEVAERPEPAPESGHDRDGSLQTQR